MQAQASYAWTVPEILRYLESHAATVLLVGGSPSVQFAPHTPPSIRSAVVPHLKARRQEIVEHFYGRSEQFPALAPEPGFVPPVPESAESLRARIIAKVREDAALAGRAFLWLKRDGLAVTDAEAKPFRRSYPNMRRVNGLWVRKVVIPVDREATHAGYYGGSWVALPKVTTRDEDELMAPKPPKRDRYTDPDRASLYAGDDS